MNTVANIKAAFFQDTGVVSRDGPLSQSTEFSDRTCTVLVKRVQQPDKRQVGSMCIIVHIVNVPFKYTWNDLSAHAPSDFLKFFSPDSNIVAFEQNGLKFGRRGDFVFLSGETIDLQLPFTTAFGKAMTWFSEQYS